MNIAGIDIGTTGCKCTVYSSKGQFIAEEYNEYFTEITYDKHVIDAEVVWNGVKDVIKRIFTVVKNIESIGVTSFGESAVLLDKDGNVLMKSMLYTDPRGKDECQSIVDKFGEKFVNDCTGLSPDKMYTISKLMWIKNNMNDVFSRCRHICLFEDYIVYKLCGVFQIDYTLASRTMAFDVNNLCWSKEILDFAGIDESLFSTPVDMGSYASYMSDELCEELNINCKPRIVSCSHDQPAAAIGTGVYKDGMAVDGTGTVECITCVFDNYEDINKDILESGKYAVVPFIDGRFITYAVSFTGGALLKWYRDNISYMESEVFKKSGKNPYEEFNKKVDKTKPSGLLVLPYFAGSGTPYMDNDAKGTILGLSLNTTSNDIYKGLMEGVTYEMRLNLDILKEAGIDIKSIRATGGGATSKVWLQMKADILKKDIISLGAAQSGTIGCIMMAGIACGFFKNLEEAENIFVKQLDVYKPNEKMSKMYDIYYEKYKNLYKLQKELKL